MKLTAKVKLNPTPEQAQALRDTLAKANEVCNEISAYAWEHQTFGQWTLHKQLYYQMRASSGLSAQMVVRCIAKVADAYKLDKKRKRIFKPTGSIAYDDRILHWHVDKETVSIWTVAKRQTIPFVCGDYQRRLLQTRQGESDLAYVDGVFYLFATCNVEEPAPEDVKGVLGIDVGIVSIAATSEGQMFSGKTINNVRARYSRFRAKLQKKGTKSAKRLLKKRSGRERRFQTDVNHCISKALVTQAQRTDCVIGIEDLKGIRSRVRVKQPQRRVIHSWAFGQLRSFIEYKARMVGVRVIAVDPRYTSQACSVCGCVDKASRKSQSLFLCASCGFSANADVNAARVIASRAAVNLPYASDNVV